MVIETHGMIYNAMNMHTDIRKYLFTARKRNNICNIPDRILYLDRVITIYVGIVAGLHYNSVLFERISTL